MSEKEIIIASLGRVERRIRSNRLFGQLTSGAVIFLAIPLLLKIWDLFHPLRGITISVVFGVWAALAIGYVVWLASRKGTLDQAAVSVDQTANLQDEIKTAFWFINNPRPSDWVDAQIRRAAGKTQTLDLDRLYPRRLSKRSYIAVVMAILFIVLNFIPLQLNHNWLALQAAPAFALSDRESTFLKQTEQLLRKAERLKQSDLARKVEDVVQQLQNGAIDAQQAAQMLENIQNELSEGNLDAASINEGLEEMAKDLGQSDKLEPTAGAMQNKDLNAAADELRKLADKLGSNSPEQSRDMEKRDMEKMEKSLEQAAENTRPGLDELAEMLKDAADKLKNGQQQGAQQALNGAAQQLEGLQQKIDSQQLKNMASQQLQSLKDSLEQRQQSDPRSGQKGQQQQEAGGRGQDGQGAKAEAGEPQDAAGESPDQNAGEPGEQGPGQRGQAGAGAAASSQGSGLMPSGQGGGADAPREGEATSLDVQLQQMKVEGIKDSGEKPEDIEESSKQERSRLDYRNVKSDLSPAEKDLLNQDRIPQEYRPLIKNYFQAIRPPAAKKESNQE